MKLDSMVQAPEHEAPALSRRQLLTGAAAAAFAAQARAVLGEDVSKLSANDLLDKLPRSIRLSNGEDAQVEKYEVRDAKYLLVVLRNVHRVSDPEKKYTKEEWKAITRSDVENGELIKRLRLSLDIRHVGLEGLLKEDIPIMEQKKKFVQQHSSPRLREAFSRTEDIPGVMTSWLNDEIEIVPIQDKETLRLARDPRLTRTNSHVLRERKSLEHLSDSLEKDANSAVAVWGANHWSTIDPLSETPWSLHDWNADVRRSDKKFSMAIITPPSVQEFQDTLED